MNDLKEMETYAPIGRRLYGTANGRDLLALGNYCDNVAHIIERLVQAAAPFFVCGRYGRTGGHPPAHKAFNMRRTSVFRTEADSPEGISEEIVTFAKYATTGL
jgi:hypothetical protein